MQKTKLLSLLLLITTFIFSCSNETTNQLNKQNTQNQNILCNINLPSNGRASYSKTDAQKYKVIATLQNPGGANNSFESTGNPGETLTFNLTTEGNYVFDAFAYLDEQMQTVIAEGQTTINDLKFSKEVVTVKIKLILKEKNSDSSTSTDQPADTDSDSTPIEIPEGFVLIQAQTFKMGCEAGYEEDQAIRNVTLTRSFYMSKYEVTQNEYESIIGLNPSYATETNKPVPTGETVETRPVETVSWYDALVYCNKRSINENLTPCYTIGSSTNPDDWESVPTSSSSTWNNVECNFDANGYRLPTEAEWECAARAGDNDTTSIMYAGTKTLSEVTEYAWYEDNSIINEADSTRSIHSIGLKLPNAYGLYDMEGNASEFCWDKYDKTSYTEGDFTDPTGPTDSTITKRIVRGSDWSSSSSALGITHYKRSIEAYNSSTTNGFRVVRTVTE